MQHQNACEDATSVKGISATLEHANSNLGAFTLNPDAFVTASSCTFVVV